MVTSRPAEAPTITMPTAAKRFSSRKDVGVVAVVVVGKIVVGLIKMPPVFHHCTHHTAFNILTSTTQGYFSFTLFYSLSVPIKCKFYLNTK